MTSRKRCVLATCMALAAPVVRAESPPACTATYARAFAGLHEAASALRLKADSAPQEVERLFGPRPDRCEPGAYAYYLTEMMRFVRRALRSGATPQTPKEGWVRAAQAAFGYAPREVPPAEIPDSLQRFQEARTELISLIVEAGAGPVPSALLPALAASMPSGRASGEPTVLILPAEPPPEVEPAPAPLTPEPSPAPGSQELGPVLGLADTYAARASELYKAGRFLESAEELRKAYLVRPKPLYLFNMAQAYRRAGHPREALSLYREFLEREPQSPLRSETRGYINDMEALMVEQERAERTRRQLQTEQARAEQVQKDLQAERERAERERRKPVYRRGWFWGALAVGAAAAIGVGLGAGLAPRDPSTDGGIVSLTFP